MLFVDPVFRVTLGCCTVLGAVDSVFKETLVLHNFTVLGAVDPVFKETLVLHNFKFLVLLTLCLKRHWFYIIL